MMSEIQNNIPLDQMALLDHLGDLIEHTSEEDIRQFTDTRIESDSKDDFVNLKRERQVLTILIDQLVNQHGRDAVYKFLISLPGYTVGLHDLKNAASIYFASVKNQSKS